MPSVVTANRLRSGEVVYLAHGDTWTTSLAEARVASGKDELAELAAIAAAAVAAREVTSVYAMDVDVSGGTPAPVSVRERIRAAHAPTV